MFFYNLFIGFFYFFIILGFAILLVGLYRLDSFILFLGVLVFTVAFLIKAEFKLLVIFWRKSP